LRVARRRRPGRVCACGALAALCAARSTRTLGGEEGIAFMKAVTNFRDLSGITSVLKLLFAAAVVLAIISLWSGLEEIELLKRIQDGRVFSEADAEASDARQAVLGGIYFLLWLITFIIFLRWTYQSNRNARFLGGNSLQYTPGWSVGWYFIPILGLWKPYLALKEIFKASHPDFGHEWKNAPIPKILPLWWTLFILSIGLGQILFRMTLRAESLEELIDASQLMLVSDLVDIPLSALGFALVATLGSLQTEKQKRTDVVAT
jgi:hypothetical protein